MSKLDHWIDNKIVQNIFIWFCLFLILTGTITSGNKLLTAFFIIILLAPAVYVNNLFILPLFNKSKLRFFIFFTINTLVFTCISVFFLSISISQNLSLVMFLNFLGVIILALTFGSALKISRDSFLRRQEEKEAELKLLKAQLNPHFLFNTLNNLYGLSVVKSDKLPSLMLKLSDLLRYSLYETKDMLVPLEKEIQYLENYISLEKIRLENQTTIEFNNSGSIESKSIAPMLLIVFVENAFKHLGDVKNKKSSVLVDLKVEHETLCFECTNSVDESKLNETALEKGRSGIGLNNVKKRLQLLYPNKHQLKIDNKNGYYHIKLKLHF
jgi:LytS/YehU family sensor histidine kinase